MDKAPNWTLTDISTAATTPASARISLTLETLRHDLAEVPRTRLIITTLFVVLAILLARYSWGYPSAAAAAAERGWVPPIAIDAERALYDTRSIFTALRYPVAQDKRIVMVVYTQETLAATAKRSPLDRAILARALTNIDAMAPEAVGIDILIDQPQPEDDILIAAMKTMKTPVWLAYSTNAANPNDVEVWQQEYMDGSLACPPRRQPGAPRLGPQRGRPRQCPAPLARISARHAPLPAAGDGRARSASSL